MWRSGTGDLYVLPSSREPRLPDSSSDPWVEEAAATILIRQRILRHRVTEGVDWLKRPEEF